MVGHILQEGRGMSKLVYFSPKRKTLSGPSSAQASRNSPPHSTSMLREGRRLELIFCLDIHTKIGTPLFLISFAWNTLRAIMKKQRG